MEKEILTLSKLEELIDQKNLAGFDEEDILVLKRVVMMVRGFDALGSFASFISKSVIWCGIIVGGIVAFRTGVIDFILSVVGQKG